MSNTLLQTKRLESNELADRYMSAKEEVIGAGYAAEIDWQEDVQSMEWTDSQFMREAAWVILSCGFREAVLKKRFPAVSTAFLDWCNAGDILTRRAKCRTAALRAFGHQGKIDAILRVVERVHSEGITAIRRELDCEGIDCLQKLPYVGPITARHLAKNLGISVVKPDRHLVRIAAEFGYGSPEVMCEEIAKLVGDTLAVIDIVFWRHAVLSNAAARAA